jgi:hypothetical protein
LAAAAQSLQAFLERASHGLSEALARLFGHLVGQSLGVRILDVERHSTFHLIVMIPPRSVGRHEIGVKAIQWAGWE